MEYSSAPLRILRILFKIIVWTGIPLVALVAAFFVYCQMVNWNAEAAKIATEIQRITGRHFFIEGEAEFTFFPRPQLIIQKARLDNIPGASNPAFVNIPTMIVTPSPLSLLTGGTHIEDVTLIAPTIALEALPDGRKTWDLSQPVDSTGTTLGSPLPATAPAPTVNISTGAFPVDAVTVKDAAIRMYNKESGYDAAVGRISGTFTARAIEGPFAFNGTLMRDRAPTGVKLTTGTWPAQGAVPVEITLRGAGSEAALKGSLTRGGGAWNYNGSLSGMVDKTLLPLGNRLADPAPGTADPRITISGNVTASPASTAITNLILEGQALKGLGEVTLNTSKPKPELAVNLIFSAMDLAADKLLPDGASTFNPALPSPEQAAQDKTFRVGDIGFGQYYELNLMKDIDMQIDVTIKQANFRNEALENWRINLLTTPNGLEVRNASAMLPGHTSTDIRGMITDTGEVDTMPLRFTGQARASGTSFLNFLKWLQVDLPPVAEGRLGEFALSANLILSKTETRMPALLARFDTTTITGGNAEIKGGEGGSSELTLTMQNLNLDDYLPKLDTLIEEAGGEAMDEQYKQLNSTLRKFDLLRVIQMSFGSLNLHLTAKNLIYKGEPIDEAGATIRFGTAQMELADLRIRSQDFDIKGKIEIDAKQLRPAVNAEFNFEDFDTANIPGVKLFFTGRDNTDADGLDPNKVSARWSKEYLELRDLTVFDGKVRVFFKSFTHQGIRIDNFSLNTRVQDGTISVDSLRGEAFGGGKIDGKAVIGVSKAPSISVSFALANGSVKQALAELFDVTVVDEGRFSLSGSITTAGADVRSLVSRAAGNMTLVARGLRVQGFDLYNLGQQLTRILSIKQVRQLADTYLAQGTTSFDYASGNIAVSGGVLGLSGFTLTSTQVPLTTLEGQIDIAGWNYNLSTVFGVPTGQGATLLRTQKAEESELPVPLRITGPIGAPTIAWDKSAFEKYWEKRFYH